MLQPRTGFLQGRPTRRECVKPSLSQSLDTTGGRCISDRGTGTNCAVDFLWCLGLRTCGCICIELYRARCTELSMSAWGTLGLKSATKTQHLDPTGQIVYFLPFFMLLPHSKSESGFLFFFMIRFYIYMLYSVRVNKLSSFSAHLS